MVIIFLFYIFFSWIKFLDDKLLIFTNKNSSKAKLLYNLAECEIRGKYINEFIFNQNKIFENKKNSFNNFNIRNSKKNLTKEFSLFSFNNNTRSSNTSNNASEKEGFKENEGIEKNNQENSSVYFSKDRAKINSYSNILNYPSEKIETEDSSLRNNKEQDFSLFKKRLNYEIEITHPFLEKCVLRGPNLLEAFDFYRKIQQIVSQADDENDNCEE